VVGLYRKSGWFCSLFSISLDRVYFLSLSGTIFLFTWPEPLNSCVTWPHPNSPYFQHDDGGSAYKTMAYKSRKPQFKFLLPWKPKISGMYQVFNFINTLPALLDIMPLAHTMVVTTYPLFMPWYVSLSLSCVCWLHAIFKTVCLLLILVTTQSPSEHLRPAHVRCELQQFILRSQSSGMWCHIMWWIGTFFPTQLTFLSWSWRQHLPPKYR
jgi:hypothetical protein